MKLVVEEGYNRGAELELGTKPVVLGRGEECTYQLLDEGVSRRHVELVARGESVSVRDLESRNGTRVNGVPVDRAEVSAGDRISLGEIRLLVVAPASGAGLEARSGPAAHAETATIGTSPGPGDRLVAPGIDAFELLGRSASMGPLVQAIGRVAPTSAPVLIQGESGTGKELVARAIHNLSPRRRRAFVVLNCAALPEELVESELFGHEKGAFTGALARKIGLAEAAHQGTLFLDELGELAGATQAKLLRFLESGEIKRLGSTEPLTVDVRLVAATHRDLDALAREGAFREDLLFRLRVVELRVPPLRERAGDVAILAEAFLRRFAGRGARFSEAALATLQAYSWPGNVRELKNAVEAAVILAGGPSIEDGDLPPRVRAAAARAEAARPEPSPGQDAPLTLKEVERRAERQAIVDALARTGGNRTRAAQDLGVDRKTLYLKMKELGCDPDSP